jgi:hypothetical protein
MKKILFLSLFLLCCSSEPKITQEDVDMARISTCNDLVNLFIQPQLTPECFIKDEILLVKITNPATKEIVLYDARTGELAR